MRPKRAATAQHLANGIPLFLDQLTSTVEAEEQGDVAEAERISGPAVERDATGALVKRSRAAMSGLLERSLGEVRARAGASHRTHAFSLAAFIADAKSIAVLDATTRGCAFAVPEVDRSIAIAGIRDHLLAALANLLQNAFKFTHPHTEVTLHACDDGNRVGVDAKNHCGGLPPGCPEKMFRPFSRGSFDTSGLGLGLPIARRTVEADGGTRTVRKVQGTGCVFTRSLPRHSL